MSKMSEDYTSRQFHLNHVDCGRLSPLWQIPLLKPLPEIVIPRQMVPFETVTRVRPPWDEAESCVHMFQHDQKLDRLWKCPNRYVSRLLKYRCVIMPDFSLYLDMPISCIQWNLYRRALVGQILQDSGVRVVPLATWAAPNTYGMCFEGLPRHSVIAVSNYGVRRNPISRHYFMQGFREMLKVVQPNLILFYGTVPVLNFAVPEIIPYAPQWQGTRVPCPRVPYQPSFVWEAC